MTSASRRMIAQTLDGYEHPVVDMHANEVVGEVRQYRAAKR